MNTSKQKAIEKAYGEYWEQVKDYVDDNGWVYVSDLLKIKLPIGKYLNCDVDDFEEIRAYRPKSLQGIEKNEGWTRIESENELPTKTIVYHVMINGSLKKALYSGKDRWFVDGNDFPKTTKLHNITHWQEIIIPNPPLY